MTILIIEAKAAAIKIGYTPEIWAADGDTPLSDKDWSELTQEQKDAAAVLGYDEESWDEDE